MRSGFVESTADVLPRAIAPRGVRLDGHWPAEPDVLTSYTWLPVAEGYCGDRRIRDIPGAVRRPSTFSQSIAGPVLLRRNSVPPAFHVPVRADKLAFGSTGVCPCQLLACSHLGQPQRRARDVLSSQQGPREAFERQGVQLCRCDRWRAITVPFHSNTPWDQGALPQRNPVSNTGSSGRRVRHWLIKFVCARCVHAPRLSGCLRLLSRICELRKQVELLPDSFNGVASILDLSRIDIPERGC